MRELRINIAHYHLGLVRRPVAAEYEIQPGRPAFIWPVGSKPSRYTGGVVIMA